MPYQLNDKLVIGVASSALFDLVESDAYFVRNGEGAYRTYQEERVDETLAPGVAFSFIRRLLGLNDLRHDNPLVEVIVLSANDPSTGLRVMRSIAEHGLSITRALFTRGQSPFEYIRALEMSLFLTARADDARAAMALGFPAGQVLPSVSDDDDGHEVRVAFDFDGVAADDEAERIFQSGDLAEFRANETAKRHVPLADGPLRELLADLVIIQRIERERHDADSDYVPRLRISIVTARNAPAHERAIRTLEAWDIRVDDAFFLGGIEKGAVLGVLRPHIYFDDQTTHVTSAALHVASVHIPYGVINEPSPNVEETA